MSGETEKVTPAQKQYNDIKAQYTDCILFFRMGDFYETFNEDAKICAKVLDLTLTTRERNVDNPTPMAGVPFHSVDKYLAKLVNHGYKVAIAEQITDPKPGQIVERKVTQIITPATFIEESAKEFVYLYAVTYTGGDVDSYHCARGDVTVGSYYTRSFHTFDELVTHLSQVQPREIVVDIDFPQNIELRAYVATQGSRTLVSTYDKPVDSYRFLSGLFGVQTLSSFGKALEDGREYAMGLLANYLQHMQDGVARSVSRIQYDTQQDDVMLDSVTVRNLEIVTSQYEGQRKYSLLGVLDKTSTALGARLFREILLHPTQQRETIVARQSRISHYMMHANDAKKTQETLRGMVDMPKIVSTILYKKNNPMSFGKLRYALSLVVQEGLYDHLGAQQSGDRSHAIGKPLVSREALEKTKEYYQYLDALLKYEGLNDDIDYIKDGYSTEIDELREIAYHSDGLLLAYQQELVQATGITNVKVKYISNQGYVLEVTPKDIDAFEAQSIKGDPKREMIRRQTLKTGQRYTSIYLDELQHKVLSAQFQLRSREQELMEDAKASLLAANAAFHELAEGIARLDVYTAHALFAKDKKYVKPTMIDGDCMRITAGRHPVIEAFLPHDQNFIPNDLSLGSCRSEQTGSHIAETENVSVDQPQSQKTIEDGNASNNSHDTDTTLAIITGPNMGGKSTYLRQNALIVLLAHCGLFVPAQAAEIPLVDGLFARVGSGDVIAKNQSTFMTEMIEMANILHNATRKSYIILDELGRGTSTYDGMALAQAIVQYIVQHIGAKTLFATHYHELIALEGSLPGVKNYSVAVYETQKDVVFMKKIVPGGADKSYGIDVAKLAGIPSVVTDAARKYLHVYERKQSGGTSGENAGGGMGAGVGVGGREMPDAMPLFAMSIDQESIDAKNTLEKIKRLLGSLDPNNMTPMQALQMIARLKGDIEK